MQHQTATEHHERHPAIMTYVRIAVVLFVMTALEVTLYYVPFMKEHHFVFVPLLLLLSAVKFGLVVAFYMELKFDSRFFTVLFVGGLALAASILLIVLALFRHGWAVVGQ